MRDDARSISFKIEADYSLLESLYDAGNWPAGVKVSRYQLFRNKNTKQFGSGGE